LEVGGHVSYIYFLTCGNVETHYTHQEVCSGDRQRTCLGLYKPDATEAPCGGRKCGYEVVSSSVTTTGDRQDWTTEQLDLLSKHPEQTTYL
jgi:hypothetical protein